ncbi:MAG: MBOAT family protein [Betaproteobacteria bacterium]|nr:MBOAT family protein [Betaproteobacteria bacterium]
MLFNSYPFLFVFLPLALAGFFLLGRARPLLAAGWLALTSLVFYGWWNPVYVALLLASIVFNFVVGLAIVREAGTRRARRLLAFGVAANLVLLGYYKYADFFVSNLNALGADLPLPQVILPLGISFFTFTQIAFLADAYQGKAAEYRFTHYCLFVTYFPHLIAGPVLHHREMMPQFGRAESYRLDWENLAVGFTIFFIGLFKKTVIADGIAVYVRPVFEAPGRDVALTALDAWGGVLAYTFQLYFDFSGYSDMAIGLSRLFGVRLPLNFHSPYKAASIIDFWRRWHMTLSRFLRDYLYFGLGGNRRGRTRRYVNLMVTMLLGGLWHGANWTFVIWGGLHGLYLLANHAWRELRARLGWNRQFGSLGKAAAVLLTFLVTVVAWAFFRADTLGDALAIVQAMAGANGVTLPYRWLDKLGAAGSWLAQHGVRFENTATFGGGTQVNWILICGLIAFCTPNTQEILRAFRPALGVEPGGVARWWHWRPAWPWLAATAVAAACAVLSLTAVSEFIYFQF